MLPNTNLFFLKDDFSRKLNPRAIPINQIVDEKWAEFDDANPWLRDPSLSAQSKLIAHEHRVNEIRKNLGLSGSDAISQAIGTTAQSIYDEFTEELSKNNKGEPGYKQLGRILTGQDPAAAPRGTIVAYLPLEDTLRQLRSNAEKRLVVDAVNNSRELSALPREEKDALYDAYTKKLNSPQWTEKATKLLREIHEKYRPFPAYDANNCAASDEYMAKINALREKALSDALVDILNQRKKELADHRSELEKAFDKKAAEERAILQKDLQKHWRNETHPAATDGRAGVTTLSLAGSGIEDRHSRQPVEGQIGYGIVIKHPNAETRKTEGVSLIIQLGMAQSLPNFITRAPSLKTTAFKNIQKSSEAMVSFLMKEIEDARKDAGIPEDAPFNISIHSDLKDEIPLAQLLAKLHYMRDELHMNIDVRGDMPKTEKAWQAYTKTLTELKDLGIANLRAQAGPSLADDQQITPHVPRQPAR